MDDAPDDKGTAAAPLARPTSEQDAIRGAFLARTAQGGNLSGGGAEDQSGAATLRGAFLKHLTEKRSGAVVGDEGAAAGVLRSIYAARTTVVAVRATARPARKAKAKAKAKAAPARKPARAAAKRAQPAKRADKKRAAAAPRRAAGRTMVRGKGKKAKGRR